MGAAASAGDKRGKISSESVDKNVRSSEKLKESKLENKSDDKQDDRTLTLESAWELAENKFKNPSVLDNAATLAGLFFPSLLEIAQDAPFFGPVAGALLMFYESYQQISSNKDAFQKLKDRMDYCQEWLQTIATYRYDVNSDRVSQISYREFVLTVWKASSFMKRANARLTSSTVSAGIKNFIFEEKDATELETLINDLEKQLERLKSDMNTLRTLRKEKEEMEEKKKTEESRQEKILEQLKQKLHPSTFQKKIEYLSKKFLEGSRQWLMNEVDAWFDNQSNPKIKSEKDGEDQVAESDRSSNKIFWIRADAGVGKSVVAAKIAEKYENKLLGSFFFEFSKSKDAEPEVLVKSLAYQMAVQYKEVREEILNAWSKLETEHVKLKDLFEELFVKPLLGMKKMKDNGSNLLIIIDALDELEKRRKLLDFLADDLLESLPSFVKILITSRPEEDIIEALENFSPYEIKEDRLEHVEDLKMYIRSIISEKVKEDSEEELIELTNVIVEKSEKTFAYLALVSEDIRRWKGIHSGKELRDLVMKLPKGLDQFFEDFVGSIGDKFEFMRDFLAVILFAYEPLTVAQVESIIGEDRAEECYHALQKIILLRKQDESDEAAKFYLFHKSVVDWFKVKSRSKKLCIDQAKSHHYLSMFVLQTMDISFEKIKGKENRKKTRGSSRTVKSEEEFDDLQWGETIGRMNCAEDVSWSWEWEKYKALDDSSMKEYVLSYVCDHLDEIGEEYASYQIMTSLTWFQGRLNSVGGLSKVIGEYLKRLYSDERGWIRRLTDNRNNKYSHGLNKEGVRVNEFEEMQYILQFIRSIRPVEAWKKHVYEEFHEVVSMEREVCSQITGRFLKLLYTNVNTNSSNVADQGRLRLQTASSRLGLLYKNAVRWLQRYGGNIVLSSRSMDQVGNGVIGSIPFEEEGYRKCVQMVWLSEMYIACLFEKVVLKYNVVTCERVGGPLYDVLNQDRISLRKILYKGEDLIIVRNDAIVVIICDKRAGKTKVRGEIEIKGVTNLLPAEGRNVWAYLEKSSVAFLINCDKAEVLKEVKTSPFAGKLIVWNKTLSIPESDFNLFDQLPELFSTEWPSYEDSLASGDADRGLVYQIMLSGTADGPNIRVLFSQEGDVKRTVMSTSSVVIGGGFNILCSHERHNQYLRYGHKLLRIQSDVLRNVAFNNDNNMLLVNSGDSFLLYQFENNQQKEQGNDRLSLTKMKEESDRRKEKQMKTSEDEVDVVLIQLDRQEWLILRLAGLTEISFVLSRTMHPEEEDGDWLKIRLDCSKLSNEESLDQKEIKMMGTVIMAESRRYIACLLLWIKERDKLFIGILDIATNVMQVILGSDHRFHESSRTQIHFESLSNDFFCYKNGLFNFTTGEQVATFNDDNVWCLSSSFLFKQSKESSNLYSIKDLKTMENDRFPNYGYDVCNYRVFNNGFTSNAILCKSSKSNYNCSFYFYDRNDVLNTFKAINITFTDEFYQASFVSRDIFAIQGDDMVCPLSFYQINLNEGSAKLIGTVNSLSLEGLSESEKQLWMLWCRSQPRSPIYCEKGGIDVKWLEPT